MRLLEPRRERCCCLSFPMRKQTGPAGKIKGSPERGVQESLSQGTPRAGSLCQRQGSLELPVFCSKEDPSGDGCLTTLSARTSGLKPSPGTISARPRGRLSALLGWLSCSQACYWPNWEPLACAKRM